MTHFADTHEPSLVFLVNVVAEKLASIESLVCTFYLTFTLDLRYMIAFINMEVTTLLYGSTRTKSNAP